LAPYAAGQAFDMSDDGAFEPKCRPPESLTRPVRLDPTGTAGPTRHQARRGRWRQTSYGFHVPADVDSEVVEQRILEQSMRLRGNGAVTGWAALRMHGAAYFDGVDLDRAGLDRAGLDRRLPVPLVSGRQLGDTVESVATRGRVVEVVEVAGVPCVNVQRALVDELIRIGDFRERVVAVDMVLAAELTSIRRLRAYAKTLAGLRRTLLLSALDLADERSQSPAETRLRLTWMLDAGLPRPLCNRVVYAFDGRVLGRPDLLDPELGVVGEYDGATHRKRAPHRRDVKREELFRRHGLECFRVVAGDTSEEQVARMLAARERAEALPESSRRWTIEPAAGAWQRGELTLDERLDLADLIRRDLGRSE